MHASIWQCRPRCCSRTCVILIWWDDSWWPAGQLLQLPAAAWQLLSSAPCPPTSCAPAAETDGDQRRQHRGREQRVTYVVIKPPSSLHPPSSSLQPRHVLGLLGGGPVQGELHLHLPATSLLAFMALLGISVDKCLDIWLHQKIASNVFWEP